MEHGTSGNYSEIGDWGEYDGHFRFSGKIPNWLKRRIPHMAADIYRHNYKNGSLKRLGHKIKRALAIPQCLPIYLNENKDQRIMSDRYCFYKITFGEGDESLYGHIYRRFKHTTKY